METATLLVQCPDQRGIVARISDFVFQHNGNVIQSDQYSTDPENGRFFMRVEFCFNPEEFASSTIEKNFAKLGKDLQAQWQFYYASRSMRMGILVSRYDHCLYDMLYRWKAREFDVVIPCIISNHGDCAEAARQFGIPLYQIEIDKDNKATVEKKILGMIQESTDFLVLARYMQILSGDFIQAYGKDIINIHHSFLPSFIGADPYRQAYERGVKVIGATAHYITANLDQGPIIEQLVERVSHRDTIEALKRKGRNLEKIALANAIRIHLEHRVMRFGNKTIVFE
jgi:formyltetrahydrofolate deformylase